MGRKIRVGIDVGGTHTKAVALDNNTYEIVGTSVVKTTHSDKIGVAAGVIECFRKCITENNLSPDDVVFIAHSTTQATNALLEGDVAKVGIIGIGQGGLEGLLAKKQTALESVSLGTGRSIEIVSDYIKEKQFSEQKLKEQIGDMRARGAKVLVASEAFGVDSMKKEDQVREIAETDNMMVSEASAISKLYGLKRRTRTAAINASILPTMMNTAYCTEMAVRQAGIKVPLMVMRGDGGVMDIGEMKKRPVLTMLSGPAASIVGALMYLRASNGIYFEVGGTSTNIGVIKNGRPAVEYATVGDHATYVSSLDVIVLGVAGGSMVRAADHTLVDVGPRSAHIGGMEYTVYTPEEEIKDPKLEFFAPKEGDPADYVCIRLASGTRVAITNSCAANVLGYVKETDYSYGHPESARRCMKVLADYLGISVEECAEKILEKSFEKIKPVIDGFIEKYHIECDQVSLVGCGGGASVLLPYSAKKMDMNYSIPENAEVISSIGVALAMIRDVVERVIPSPTQEDIAKIKKEAKNLAVRNGAMPDSVEVQIEIDSQTSKVTAIALGSTEVKTTDPRKLCSENDARSLAAKSMRIKENEVRCELKNDFFFVFTADIGNKHAVRIMDRKGFIKVQRKDAKAIEFLCGDWEKTVGELWREEVTYKAEMEHGPDMYLCIGGKVLDFESAMDLNQLKTLMKSEFLESDPQERAFLIAARYDMDYES